MTSYTKYGVFEYDKTDHYIANDMRCNRIFEEKFVDLLIEKYISKCKYVADIGANIGCHCVSYAKSNPNVTVYAFEPQKELFSLLEKNVKNNGLVDRVKLHDFGLGNDEYTVTLNNREINRIGITFDPDTGGILDQWNKGGLGFGKGGEEIKVKTLDSMNLPGLDFMKLDVEGAEGLVIMGARETIKKYHPIIFFEHNNQRVYPDGVNFKVVPTPFEELSELGYKEFHYVGHQNYITFI